MSEPGKVIAGAGSKRSIDDVDRLVSQYGGQPGGWQKMSSTSFVNDGVEQQTHWYRNKGMGIYVERRTNLYFGR
ncbi:hypothetical protein ACPPVW_07920 [Leifsonia sp. McL0607]|uniref:hypothetical protein n=1 Tax=Leifsonia sp. McL0607 TaxID=3415672 RepID=UPI003CFB5B03